MIEGNDSLSHQFKASESFSYKVPYTDFFHFPVDWTSVIPALSFVSAIFVLSLCIKSKFYKTSLQTMVFMVNLSIVIYLLPIVAFLIIEPDSDTYCKVASVPLAYGIESSAMWAAFFSHALWRTSAGYNMRSLDKAMKYYYLFGTLIPIANVIRSPFTTYLEYSDKSSSCYHRAYLSEFDWSGFIFADAFVYTASILSIGWYYLAYRNRSKRKMLNRQRQNFLLMVFIPAVLLVCCLPVRILKFWVYFGTEPFRAVITGTQMLAFFQGFLNAVVYGGRSNQCFQRLLTNRRKEVNDPTHEEGMLHNEEDDGDVIASEHSFTSLEEINVHANLFVVSTRTISQSEIVEKPEESVKDCSDQTREERIYSY